MFLMFDEKTEELADELGLEVCFPPARLRQHLDNKVVTTRIADEAGVECVPNVLAKVDSYETLRRISRDLGPDLVIQTPFGDSGHTTFFISDEDDWRRHAEEIVAEPEVKVMKRIRPRGTAVEACVTRHGTIVAPLMTELVGLRGAHALQGRLVRQRDLRRRLRRERPRPGPQCDVRDRRAPQARGLPRLLRARLPHRRGHRASSTWAR